MRIARDAGTIAARSLLADQGEMIVGVQHVEKQQVANRAHTQCVLKVFEPVHVERAGIFSERQGEQAAGATPSRFAGRRCVCGRLSSIVLATRASLWNSTSGRTGFDTY